MEFRILGPLEVRSERRRVALGRVKPRAVLAVLLLHPNRAGERGAAGAGVVGRGRAGRRGQDGAGARVAVAQGARGSRDRGDHAGGLSAARAVPRSWTRSVSRAGWRRAAGARRGPGRGGGGAAARGAGVVARAAAGRSGVRAVRAGRDRAAGGAAVVRRSRRAWRPTWPPAGMRALVGRAAAAAGRAPDARAARGAADAGAVSQRAPVRGAGGVPRRAPGARRGRRASSPGRSCSACMGRSSTRIRRWSSSRRPRSCRASSIRPGRPRWSGREARAGVVAGALGGGAARRGPAGHGVRRRRGWARGGWWPSSRARSIAPAPPFASRPGGGPPAAVAGRAGRCGRGGASRRCWSSTTPTARAPRP